jgi:hypothetical protein
MSVVHSIAAMLAPVMPKEKNKEVVLGVASEILATNSWAGECGILNACHPTNMPAHTCNRNGYI